MSTSPFPESICETIPETIQRQLKAASPISTATGEAFWCSDVVEPSSPPSSALVILCSEALSGPHTCLGDFPLLAP